MNLSNALYLIVGQTQCVCQSSVNKIFFIFVTLSLIFNFTFNNVILFSFLTMQRYDVFQYLPNFSGNCVRKHP